MRGNLILSIRLTTLARIKMAYGLLAGSDITLFHVELRPSPDIKCPSCTPQTHPTVIALAAYDEAPVETGRGEMADE